MFPAAARIGHQVRRSRAPALQKMRSLSALPLMRLSPARRSLGLAVGVAVACGLQREMTSDEKERKADMRIIRSWLGETTPANSNGQGRGAIGVRLIQGEHCVAVVMFMFWLSMSILVPLSIRAVPVETARASVWIEAETAAAAKGLAVRNEKLASGGAILNVFADRCPGVEPKWVFATELIHEPMNVIVRYASQFTTHHEVVIDGVEVGTVSLPSSCGFGKKEEEWAEVAFPVSQGLPAGKHTLSLRSGFGARSVNLDRLGLG